jgi:hypothetical protein
MVDQAAQNENCYEILVAGYLDEHWSEWLGDLNIYHNADGNSRLNGAIPDQAALYGILVKIRDLGLTLISLNRSDIVVDY